MRRLDRPAVVATLLCVASLAAPARGDTPAPASSLTTEAPRAMSLGEALAYARAHQPELRAAAERVAVVTAEGTITRARWYPTIGGAAELLATTTNNTTGSYVAVPTFDNPRVSATAAASSSTAGFAPHASSLLGVGVRQEVFDFGRISARAAADDLRADAERFAQRSTALVIDYAVEEAWFSVYAAKSILKAADEAYARAGVHRDLARGGTEAGMRRPIELTRAEATLDQYQLDRIRAVRGVAMAQSVLAAAVGVPEPRLDIAAAPPEPPELPSLEKALALAMTRNPDLAAAMVRIRAEERQSEAVGAELRPNLFLTGAFSGNAGGSLPSSGAAAADHGLLPNVPNWDVGFVLSWPLFDETVHAREEQSRRQTDVRRAEGDALRLQVVAHVEQAYIDVQTARDALPVLRHTLDAAVANYDQANARFGAGMGDAVELADAEALRTTSEIQLAIGTFELARTRAELGRVISEGL